MLNKNFVNLDHVGNQNELQLNIYNRFQSLKHELRYSQKVSLNFGNQLLKQVKNFQEFNDQNDNNNQVQTLF